jgi:hypothetical protein
MSDDVKKIAYMIAALETSQAEISVATANMQDTALECKRYAAKLRESTNFDIIEMERRLAIGTESFREAVKKEIGAVSDIGTKALLKIVGISVSTGLVVAAAVAIYAYVTLSSLTSARAELASLQPRVEKLQVEAMRLESVEAIRPIIVTGARRAVTLPGAGWEVMKSESGDTILYKR